MKTFRGLNKTMRVPFPKPKTRPHDATTFPGSAPDNGKLKSEAYVAPDTGNNNYAQSLPVPAGTKKTNMNKKLSKSTIAAPSTQYEDSVIMSLNDLDPIFEAYSKALNNALNKEVDDYVYEELKVGEEEDNNEAKKVRGTNAKGPGTGKVKRKYLGKQRGTTATGKPAHVIITEPVIGEKDKDWNKTTPSGDRKKD